MMGSGSALTVTFVLIILVELSCGLVATIFTAFFHDKVRSVWWGYSILAIYGSFVSIVVHHVAREIWCTNGQPIENQTHKRLAKVSWHCWMSTVVTFGIFGVLYFYDTIALRQTSLNTVVSVALVVFVLTVLMMIAVSCTYLCEYLCPLGSSGGESKRHSQRSARVIAERKGNA